MVDRYLIKNTKQKFHYQNIETGQMVMAFSHKKQILNLLLFHGTIPN